MFGRWGKTSSDHFYLTHPALILRIVPLTATRSPSSHSAIVALLLSCHLLEMSANLQTLRVRSAMLSRGGVFRLRHFPMSQALFFHHHLVPSAISSPFAKARLATRWPRATGGSDQVDGSRHFNAKDFSSPELFLWAMPFFDFARNNFLPLGLVSGILLGLASPSLGLLAERYSVSKFSTIGIFLISGLMLRSEEIGAAVEAWPAGILGVTSILLLTPIFARVILQVHLNPHEFVTGLAIFCCMPTTLSSGVALTQLVGGNSALALAMTIISNLIGIMTVPFTLAKFVGGSGVSVPTMQLFKSLVLTLLVPLTLGKVLRDSIKSVAIYVDQNRRSLSMISAILLSLVPGTQVSRSKSLLLTVRPEMFATAVCMGALLHLVLLALNTLAVRILSIFCGGKESVLTKRENTRAVIIVASQKTLPVMVAIVEQLKGALGNPGLLVLPCVAAHINQIIIDSFLVDWWIKSHPSTTPKECRTD